MSNHYHLLVQTPADTISSAMPHTNGVYTQSYNRHRNIDGQLFCGRYRSVLVEEDQHLLARGEIKLPKVALYLALNVRLYALRISAKRLKFRFDRYSSVCSAIVGTDTQISDYKPDATEPAASGAYSILLKNSEWLHSAIKILFR